MSSRGSMADLECYWAFLRVAVGMTAEIGASVMLALAGGAGASMFLSTDWSEIMALPLPVIES